MDFDWTEDASLLRRAAEEFAAAELTAGAADRDREGVFSRESWEACARFGLQGLLVPPAWGGGGHDLLSAVAILEGIGRGARDNGLVFSVAAHAASCVGPVVDHGTDAQKRRVAAEAGRRERHRRDRHDRARVRVERARPRRHRPARRRRLGPRRLEDVRHERAGGGRVRPLREDRAGLRAASPASSSRAVTPGPHVSGPDREDGPAHEPDWRRCYLEGCRVPGDARAGPASARGRSSSAR